MRYSLSVHTSKQPKSPTTFYSSYLKKKKKVYWEYSMQKAPPVCPSNWSYFIFPQGSTHHHWLSRGWTDFPACPTLPRPLPVNPAVSGAQPAACVLSLLTPHRPWLKLWPSVCHSLPFFLLQPNFFHSFIFYQGTNCFTEFSTTYQPLTVTFICCCCLLKLLTGV